MKLSELIYLAVKNVIYFDDISFTYEAFLQGKFDEDPDYATNIQNAFSPLNEALARLSDLERIPYRVETLTDIVNNLADIRHFTHRVKEIIAVGQILGDTAYNMRKIAHVQFGLDKVKLNSWYDRRFPVYIEYKEDLPVFKREDIAYYTVDGEGLPTLLPEDQIKDVDLYLEHGITDSMCNYIMEYMMGKLAEPMAAELANMHITRAETYFNNITPVKSAFVQDTVKPVYKVGE